MAMPHPRRGAKFRLQFAFNDRALVQNHLCFVSNAKAVLPLPRTRQERADDVQKRDTFTKYGEQARAVLRAFPNKYRDSELGSLESMEILKVEPIQGLGTPVEIINLFGGKDDTPHVGLHITLSQFGFGEGVSPGLQSKVARQVALCPSIAFVHKELTGEGIDISIKKAKRIKW